MFKMTFVRKTAVFLLLALGLYLFIRPPAYKRHLILKDPARAVQDSMIVLRQLCEVVNSKSFMNCVITVKDGDSTLLFNTIPLGPLNAISSSNKAFGYLTKEEVVRLLSIMKFLNRNLIAGLVHDTYADVWLYPYGQHFYDRNIEYVRSLYIVEKPRDTLNTSFKFFYHVIDRKEKIALVGFNNVHVHSPFKPVRKRK